MIQIEDYTRDMEVIAFGRTVQALIKKPCSTLTIDENFTDPFIIPPIIDLIRGQSKIFQIFFQQRGTQMSTLIFKIFEDIHIPSSPRKLLTAGTEEQHR